MAHLIKKLNDKGFKFGLVSMSMCVSMVVIGNLILYSILIVDCIHVVEVEEIMTYLAVMVYREVALFGSLYIDCCRPLSSRCSNICFLGCRM